MGVTLRLLFVLCAAVSAAVDAAVPQSGAILPVVYSENGTIHAAMKENVLYSGAVQVEPQKRGLLRGRKSLLSAVGLLVGVATVTVLSFLLWKCFVEVRKGGGFGFWHRRLAEGSCGGRKLESQKVEGTEGSGDTLQEKSTEGSGEESQDGSTEESGEESQDESEGRSREAEKSKQEGEEESEEEDLQYDPRLFEPAEESVIQWVNKKVSKAQKELEKRQEKLANGDQMTLDLKKYVDRLQRLYDEMCELSQREADLRGKFFSLKARVEQESDLAEMLEQTRNKLRRAERRSTDALSRLRDAVERLTERENRWCEEHGLLPLHEHDPGFQLWSDFKAETISFEESETKRRREALERGEEVYKSSEPLNRKRIDKLEVARSRYQDFLQVQQEYFQKKKQAEENPERSDLQQAFQDVRRQLYDAHARADEAFKKHHRATRELVNYEHSWSVAHNKKPPKDPYIVPFSAD